ncbi:MAG: GNAT family N-acetyltransferase, partial [bacterium]|nr:GNAT family N-acetyltransferase [bacterium]
MDIGQINIRQEENFVPEIAQLNKNIFAGLYQTEPYDLKIYQKRLSAKKSFIYTVWAGKQLIGDSLAYVVDKSLYLWVLGVDKNFRGRGIATKFLEINENLARKNQLLNITTKVYNVSSEMQSLLEKHAYRVFKVEASKTDQRY